MNRFLSLQHACMFFLQSWVGVNCDASLFPEFGVTFNS